MCVAEKFDAVIDIYEIYKATQSSGGLINVTTKVVKLVAGVAAGYIFDKGIETMQSSRLRRVSDSMGKKFMNFDELSQRGFIANQKIVCEVTEYVAGKATNKLIEVISDYVTRNQSLDEFFDLTTDKSSVKYIDKDFFGQILNWRFPQDSLVLDLDGDGIEITSTSNSVLFDHNKYSIRIGSSAAQAIADFAAQQPALYAQLSALERFNSQPVIERYTRATNASYYDSTTGTYKGYTFYSVSIE